MPPFVFFEDKRNANQRQDKGGKRHGDAFVVFYLELLDIGKTALPLPVYVLAQLRAGQHFLLVFHYEEVGRFHKESGIHAALL